MIVLKPTEDRLLVKPLDTAGETKGGIVLPETARTAKHRGVVVAAGPGRIGQDGVQLPMWIEEGQVVQFSAFGAGEAYQNEDGEEFVWMRQSDILCIVEEVMDTSDLCRPDGGRDGSGMFM